MQKLIELIVAMPKWSAYECGITEDKVGNLIDITDLIEVLRAAGVESELLKKLQEFS
jgi:hypothetical protein